VGPEMDAIIVPVLMYKISTMPQKRFTRFAHCEKGTCKKFFFRTYSYIITENSKS
jgi:hypothetical protein